MTSNEILKADVLDILFDNRNKQYGAYALRKNYNNRLGIALGNFFKQCYFVFFLVIDQVSIFCQVLTDDKDEHSSHRPFKFLPEIKKADPSLPTKTNSLHQQFRQKEFHQHW